MPRTKTILVFIFSLLAVLAPPAAATANEGPAIGLSSYPAPFSSSSEEASVLYGGSFRFTCESHTTSGEFTDPHTGWIQMTFKECEDNIFESECSTSAGGVITTQTMTFHTVYLKPAEAEKSHERPGIVIMPNEGTGKFAEFSCTEEEGLEVAVKGTGLLGTVTEPAIGEGSSSAISVALNATGEGQQHTETLGGETFGLNVSYNGNEPEAAYQAAGTNALTLAGEAEATTATDTSSFEPTETPSFEEAPAVSLPSYPTAFTSSGGENVWASGGSSFGCESTTGEGEFTSAHTGSTRLRFEGCAESVFGTKCTTPGHAAGTIVSQELILHTAYLKSEGLHEAPGVAITPEHATGTFAGFACFGGLTRYVVKGNGLLGTVTEPGLEEAFSSAAVEIAATEEGQQHTETAEGEEFGLEASVNGSELEPLSLSAGTALTLSGPEAEGVTTTE